MTRRADVLSGVAQVQLPSTRLARPHTSLLPRCLRNTWRGVLMQWHDRRPFLRPALGAAHCDVRRWWPNGLREHTGVMRVCVSRVAPSSCLALYCFAQQTVARLSAFPWRCVHGVRLHACIPLLKWGDCVVLYCTHWFRFKLHICVGIPWVEY